MPNNHHQEERTYISKQEEKEQVAQMVNKLKDRIKTITEEDKAKISATGVG